MTHYNEHNRTRNVFIPSRIETNADHFLYLPQTGRMFTADPDTHPDIQEGE